MEKCYSTIDKLWAGIYGGEGLQKTELLNSLTTDREDRLLLARALDQLELTRRRAVPAHTPFLSPHQQQLVRRLIATAGYPRAVFLGGYPEAERRLCLFLPDWMEEEDAACEALCALRATWRDGAALTHRDFLGALMGMGITREKTGDLLVNEGSCDMILLEELRPFLLQSMESAGHSRLTLTAIDLEELQPPRLQVRQIRDTVATLRLDAVCATGFSVSRTRAAEFISAGRVSVNWQLCTKTDVQVEEGVVLSCRGLGKCRLTRVLGTSRKGRVMIEMERYQ